MYFSDHDQGERRCDLVSFPGRTHFVFGSLLDRSSSSEASRCCCLLLLVGGSKSAPFNMSPARS